MIFMAVMLSALMACILLVLDIGNLYAAQRNLEQQATLAALAGAQSLCMTTVTPAGEVANSITENTLSGGSAPKVGGPLTGYIDSSSGTQVFSTATKPPNVPGAVQVNLSATSPPGLASALASRKSITMNASAAASERLYGKYMVGTSIANIAGATVGVPFSLALSGGALLPPLAGVGAVATLKALPTATNFVSSTYEASSADILVQVRMNVNLALPGFVAASLPLGIDIAIPAATANLVDISCPSSTNPLAYTATVIAQTAEATVTVGTFSGSPTALPAAPLLPGKATLATLSVLGVPVVTLNQLSAAAPLSVAGSSPTPLSFDNFANNSGSTSDEAACSDEIYGSGPNADLCYVAAAPGNVQLITAADSSILETTINSALNGFLGDLSASVLPGLLPPLPVNVGSLPGEVATVLTTGTVGTIGAAVDAQLGTVLSELGTTLGPTPVTFLAVEHGSPLSNTFATVASGN